MQPSSLLKKRVKLAEDRFLWLTHKHKTLLGQLQKGMVLLALGYFGMSGRPLLKYHRLLRYSQRPALRPAIILHRLFLLFTSVLTVLCCLTKRKIPPPHTHACAQDVHFHSGLSSMLFGQERRLMQYADLGLKLSFLKDRRHLYIMWQSKCFGVVRVWTLHNSFTNNSKVLQYTKLQPMYHNIFPLNHANTPYYLYFWLFFDVQQFELGPWHPININSRTAFRHHSVRNYICNMQTVFHNDFFRRSWDVATIRSACKLVDTHHIHQ